MGNFFNIQDLLSKESSPIHLNISICTEIQTMLFITKILSEFIQKISFMEAGQMVAISSIFGLYIAAYKMVPDRPF